MTQRVKGNTLNILVLEAAKEQKVFAEKLPKEFKKIKDSGISIKFISSAK